MKKTMFILFFTVINLFAIENTINFKAKAKQKNETIYTKILLKGNFISPKIAKIRKKNPYFVKQIVVSIGGDIIYNISLNHTYINNKRSIFLKFSFLYEGRGDTITISAIDSNDKNTKYNFKIKGSLGLNKKLNKNNNLKKYINYWETKPNLWNIIKIDDAMNELYRTDNGLSSEIKIKELLNNRAYLSKINIHSNIYLKSIAIFSYDLVDYSNRKYQSKLPAIRAIISVPKNTNINDSSFLIRTNGECCTHYKVPLVVAGEDNDGNIYKSSTEVDLLCSADCEM